MCVCVCVFLPEREVDSSSVDFIFLNLGKFQKFETSKLSTVNPLLVYVSPREGDLCGLVCVERREREKEQQQGKKYIITHEYTYKEYYE